VDLYSNLSWTHL